MREKNNPRAPGELRPQVKESFWVEQNKEEKSPKKRNKKGQAQESVLLKERDPPKAFMKEKGIASPSQVELIYFKKAASSSAPPICFPPM